MALHLPDESSVSQDVCAGVNCAYGSQEENQETASEEVEATCRQEKNSDGDHG